MPLRCTPAYVGLAAMASALLQPIRSVSVRLSVRLSVRSSVRFGSDLSRRPFHRTSRRHSSRPDRPNAEVPLVTRCHVHVPSRDSRSVGSARLTAHRLRDESVGCSGTRTDNACRRRCRPHRRPESPCTACRRGQTTANVKAERALPRALKQHAPRSAADRSPPTWHRNPRHLIPVADTSPSLPATHESDDGPLRRTRPRTRAVHLRRMRLRA
jgi:hypothetical protein